MMALTSDRTPTTFERAAEQMLRDLNEATELLAASKVVPPQVEALVDRFDSLLCARNPEAGLASVDPYLAEGLLGGAVVCLKALRQKDATRARRDLRLGLEQVRQALRDVVDEHPVRADEHPKDLVRWLVDVVSLPQGEIARAFGVAPRTLQRWLSESDPSAPTGADETRVRILARLVGHLRHSFTGPGTFRWLERPHPLLADRAPLSLLEDEARYPELVHLAARARSMVAT